MRILPIKRKKKKKTHTSWTKKREAREILKKGRDRREKRTNARSEKMNDQHEGDAAERRRKKKGIGSR